MQVFLPFSDIEQSLKSLDKTRLGNQIWREGKTLLTGGWKHHPVAKMWEQYKPALVCYMYNGLHILSERKWIAKKAYDKLFHELTNKIVHEYAYAFNVVEARLLPEFNPPFIGNEEFHLSHRLNLLYKGQQDVAWSHFRFHNPHSSIRRRDWTDNHYQQYWISHPETVRPELNWYTKFFTEQVPTSKPDYVWVV